MKTFENLVLEISQNAADFKRIIDLKDKIADLVQKKYDIVLDDMVAGMSKSAATEKNMTQIKAIASQIANLRRQIDTIKNK